MPRKPEKESQDLEDRLKSWPTVFNNEGSLKKENDPVWKEIKDSMKLKMNAKSLYLYLYNDRHSCKSRLQAFFKKVANKSQHKLEDKDIDFHPTDLANNNPMNCKKINFEITVPKDEIITCFEGKTKKKNTGLILLQWRYLRKNKYLVFIDLEIIG